MNLVYHNGKKIDTSNYHWLPSGGYFKQVSQPAAGIPVRTVLTVNIPEKSVVTNR